MLGPLVETAAHPKTVAQAAGLIGLGAQPGVLSWIVIAFLAGHLAAAVVTDLRSGRIPDRLVASLTLGGLVALVLGGWESLMQGLAGSALALALLTGITLLARGAIGGGDIKLMAATGLFLGPAQTIEALSWTFIAGGVLSLLMLCLGLVTMRESIPYAVAIAVGVAVTLLVGV